MRIGVVGSGYVGLTTGICLASLKHDIFIYDLDKEKLDNIKNAKLPFFERGLEEILEEVISSEKLVPQEDLDDLVNETDGCFICVGTPTKNNSIDLTPRIFDALLAEFANWVSSSILDSLSLFSSLAVAPSAIISTCTS